MANLNAVNSINATLAPAAVDVVTLMPSVSGRIAIKNRDASAALYFRYDGIDPTVDGKECFVALPGERVTFMPTQVPIEVRIISIATLSYSVMALP